MMSTPVQEIRNSIGLLQSITGEKIVREQSPEMSLEDAKFALMASRDWLNKKRASENLMYTGEHKADYAALEKIQEEMAYIRKNLEHLAEQYGFSTAREMVRKANEVIQSEISRDWIDQTSG